ncbi:uncharacterized protein LOC123313459 [Coccinella septempunctata]|uniref:uncharacterized protein LOC123313459 n=1 Tax=Coccinella septempunctata TaxID=41139 RepID=UPI001D09258A|nr:uncharacterized protein LOC123313459 [Coccinella septempunctata]
MLKRAFTIIYIIFYYCNSVSTLYTGEVSLDDYGNKVSRRDQTFDKRKKISAVLFFADTVANENYHNYTGLQCLKLKKKPAIKHCTEVPRSIFARKKRNWNFKKRTCSCYARLQEAIMSLLNFAQNSLGMVTALGSLSNHSFSNSIRFGNTEININDHYDADAGQHEEHTDDSLKEKISHALDVGPGTSNETGQEDGNPDGIPDKEEKNYEKVPLLNVFPKDSPPPLFAFTDAEERRKRSEGPYVLEPEHREVFKIKTKRQVTLDKPKEISDATYLNRESKVNTIFDIMDIMRNMQKSLFGTMLQDESDSYPHDGESCPFPHNILGRIRQPGLFEVVQKTLYTVINSSDTGFLMIIIGGNLSDISSSYTPLVQSIKHVAENTDEESTLIVLTGTCPNSPDSRVKLACEELNKRNLPLFATGPGSQEFSSCYELYDVPLTVKRILSKYNSNSKEARPQDLEIPEPTRSKRGIIDVDDEDDDYDDEDEFHVNPKRAARVTGGAGREKTKSGSTVNQVHMGIIDLNLFLINIYMIYW